MDILTGILAITVALGCGVIIGVFFGPKLIAISKQDLMNLELSLKKHWTEEGAGIRTRVQSLETKVWEEANKIKQHTTGAIVSALRAPDVNPTEPKQ